MRSTSVVASFTLVLAFGTGCPSGRKSRTVEQAPPARPRPRAVVALPARVPAARTAPVRRALPPPAAFKENYKILSGGKAVGRAFLGFTDSNGRREVQYRFYKETPTGPLYLRDVLRFDEKWHVVSADFHKFHKVAPKLQIVWSSYLTRSGSGWQLRKRAFGYEWLEPVAADQLEVPVGRLWLVGAQVVARVMAEGKQTHLEVQGFDPETFKAVPLRADRRRSDAGVSIRVERPDGKVAEVVYDPSRGGVLRVVDWSGVIYEAGARPFSAPMPPSEAKVQRVAPFVWPSDLPQQEVTLREAGAVLRGSLSLPPKGNPRVALILVPGAGRLDRDGTMGLRKPYADMAAALTRAGFAVLRYDKRGVGRSAGSYEASDLERERKDLFRWIGTLRHNPRTRRAKIVLLAHGEGVYAAAYAAAKLRVVRGLVLLAPPGRPYEQVLVGRYRREWEFGALPATVIASRIKYLEDSLAAIRKGSFSARTWLARPEYSVAWLRQVLDVDVIGLFKRVRKPVLLLRGSADIFTTEEDVSAIVRTLLGRTSIQAPAALDHVGHYLQKSPHPLEIAPEEWLVPSPVDRRVIDWIVRWLPKIR